MMQINFSKHKAPGAQIEDSQNGMRLSIPKGKSDHYRVAQLDDYANLSRARFPHRHTLRLSLRARASDNSLPGTWGFGLWNNPFGFSLGFGGNRLQFPALPNAIWFFQASKENHLSFKDKPGNGFLVQVFRSPIFPIARLTRISIALLYSRMKARKLMGNLIEEDGNRLSVDVTDWHTYRLEWSPDRSVFWVDDRLVLDTPVSPRPPLGLVIWIDNQYAAFKPDGEIGFGLLENTEPAWLHIEEFELIKE